MSTTPIAKVDTSSLSELSNPFLSKAKPKEVTLNEIVNALLRGLAPFLSSRKLEAEDCCASLALNLQMRGFEAHPLRVEVHGDYGVRPHCVVLAKNDGTVNIKSFNNSDYILIELLDVKDFREFFGGEAIRYNCAQVRDSIFDPLAHLTAMEKGKALLLSHLFI